MPGGRLRVGVIGIGFGQGVHVPAFRSDDSCEVAVIAAPDERLGQRVVACVVADEGVTEAELDAFCLASERLARFKRPREYRFVPELPKSPSGKILRRMLRKQEVEA